MNRAELEHIIRAASAVTGDKNIVVIGSQAILGTYPQAPASLLRSRKADIYPKGNPDDATAIDANIGEMSAFDETFGYYAHGVGPETAVAPAGWEQRLVPGRSENTGGATGWCLEVHDLVIAKAVADRERDWEFVEESIRHGLVSADVLGGRLASLPIPAKRRGRLARQLDAAIERAR